MSRRFPLVGQPKGSGIWAHPFLSTSYAVPARRGRGSHVAGREGSRPRGQRGQSWA